MDRRTITEAACVKKMCSLFERVENVQVGILRHKIGVNVECRLLYPTIRGKLSKIFVNDTTAFCDR